MAKQNGYPGSNGHHEAKSVLVVGDVAGARALIEGAMGGVRVEASTDWFDAIARLGKKRFDAVLAPTKPVERRAESAVKYLREAAGTARLVLLAEPGNEILSRKLVEKEEGEGCDEYVIWPATGMELAEALSPAVRSARQPVSPPAAAMPRRVAPSVSHAPHVAGAKVAGGHWLLEGVDLAEIMLEALVREPQDAARAAIRDLNTLLPKPTRFALMASTDRDPNVPTGMTMMSRVLPRVGPNGVLAKGTGAGGEKQPVLHVLMAVGVESSVGRAMLDAVAPHVVKLLQLQERHSRLQKIAITDELTGLYNLRYFKHFLERILIRAQEQRSPVTLLLFDIDDFKKYNDQFGHAIGDEILKETGSMMRKCVRDHDLVARLGGDEFAVVFWEKGTPRAANTPPPPYPPSPLPPPLSSPAVAAGGVPGRPPQSPVQIFQRFARMIAGPEFKALGNTGQGQLTISGGLAVYPYDARTAEELIEAADKKLMFGAKKSGKNTLHLVGPEENDARQ